MAITRSRQAKQMLRKGGRIGLQGGGKDAATRSFAESAYAGDTAGFAGASQFGFQGEQGLSKQEVDRRNIESIANVIDRGKKADERRTAAINRAKTEAKEKRKTIRERLNEFNLKKRQDYINRILSQRQKTISSGLFGVEDMPGVDLMETEDYFGFAPSITEFGPKGTGKYSQQFIDDVLSGKRKPPEFFTKIDPSGGMLTSGLAGVANVLGPFMGGPITLEELERLNKEKKDIMNIDPSKTTVKEMMEIYEPNRFKLLNPEFEGAEPDPCKGPNPPAYCFTGIRSVESETTEPEPEQLLTSRILGTQFAADGGRAGYRVGGASGREYDQKYDPNKKATDTPMTTSGGGGGDGDGLKITPRRIDRSGKRGPDVTTFKERKPFDFVNFSPEELVNLGIVGEDKEDDNMLMAKTYSTGDIEKLLGIKDQETAEKFVTDPIVGSPRFLTRDDLDQKNRTQAEAMEKFRKNLIEEETEQLQKTFDQQRSSALTRGISPDDQILIPSDFLDKRGEAATQTPFSTIAKEIEAKYPMADGGRAGLVGGGIASLDREAFLLGGIAKGLKKAVRGVKKLAKSPIGKAALGAALFKFGGGLGGLKGKLFGLPGVDEFGGTMGLFGKLKLTGGFGSYMPTALGGITLASLAAGAMTPKEDEDKFDVDKYYAQSLDPSLSVRGTGSEFDFYGGQFVADGGRIGYQEGSKEPVAKKTLPLIDMDGMEKDYRETGGFVEMGRMEKADDVPARLSKNEFVFTADAVRNAGEGDIDKGAEVMYNMMKNLEAGGEVSEESQGLEGAREMFQTSQRLGEVI